MFCLHNIIDGGGKTTASGKNNAKFKKPTINLCDVVALMQVTQIVCCGTAVMKKLQGARM